MAKNKTYGEVQNAGVAALVKNGSYDKATAHVHYDATKLEHPEGITNESIALHVPYFNALGGQVTAATAEVARTAHAENKDILKVDGTLTLPGGMVIHSEHELRQKVGENEYLFGQSTTMVDYQHSEEAAAWYDSIQASNAAIAESLFK